MMPLLPPSEIFHCSRRSKSPNSSTVTMSPPAPVRVSAPSTTAQPDGGASDLNPRHPSSVRPLNSDRSAPCIDARASESKRPATTSTMTSERMRSDVTERYRVTKRGQRIPLRNEFVGHVSAEARVGNRTHDGRIIQLL